MATPEFNALMTILQSGSCNLNTTTSEAESWRSNAPGDIITDSLSLRQAIKEDTLQDGKELKSLRSENLGGMLRLDLAEDNNIKDLGIERHAGMFRKGKGVLTESSRGWEWEFA